MEVIADNTSGGGFVLEKRIASAKPTGMLRLSLDGQLATEGMIESLGNAAERLQWLAQEVGGLQAGQVVFLGSTAASIPAREGSMEIADSFGSSMIVTLVLSF